jgi:ATP-dependent exoDNAse (exonuclease V) alpha subunit
VIDNAIQNDRELGNFNGDVGNVNTGSREQYTSVFFDGRLLAMSGKESSNLNLSYAITIHKVKVPIIHVIIPMRLKAIRLCGMQIPSQQ